MAIIYGQDEREMWLEITKHLYVVFCAEDTCSHDDCFKYADIGARKFVDAMREHQKQEGGK